MASMEYCFQPGSSFQCFASAFSYLQVLCMNYFGFQCFVTGRKSLKWSHLIIKTINVYKIHVQNFQGCHLLRTNSPFGTPICNNGFVKSLTKICPKSSATIFKFNDNSAPSWFEACHTSIRLVSMFKTATPEEHSETIIKAVGRVVGHRSRH